MKLARNIILGLIGLIVLLGGIGMLLPRQVEVARSIDIAAPQHTIYTVLTSLKAFNEWSPWSKRDPDMARAYDGPPVGVGARVSWSSAKSDVGNGAQEIIEASPDDSIRMRIEFEGAGEAEALFTLKPSPNGTTVTWSFATDLGGNPFFRYMGLVFPGAIGKDYEEGLAGLKDYVERLPKVDFDGITIEHVKLKADMLLMVRTTADGSAEGFSQSLSDAIGRLSQVAYDLGLEPAGYPVSIAIGTENGQSVFDVGIPVSGTEEQVTLPGDMRLEASFEGIAIRAIHIGGYDMLSDSTARLLAYSSAIAAKTAGPSWNEYVSDPQDVPEGDLITNIYLPVE